MIERTPYDVAVLDIRMPGLDGVTVMERAAEIRPAMATILLTGYASLETAIAALRANAVDYLCKPASVGEIARAIASALQRRAHGGSASDLAQDRFLQAGPLMLDQETRQFTVTPDPVTEARCARLTKSEAEVVAHLMRYAGVVVSCRDLARALGYDVDEEEARAVVRPHISRVRKKIELDSSTPQVIQTVPRQGYTLRI
jgi:two-component system KDP operon response regulator KdpE